MFLANAVTKLELFVWILNYAKVHNKVSVQPS